MLEKCLSKKLLSEKEAVEIHMELLNITGNLYSTDGDLPKARKAYNKAIQIGNDKFGDKKTIPSYVFASINNNYLTIKRGFNLVVPIIMYIVILNASEICSWYSLAKVYQQ
ncbi:MAG: hypothetical protein LUC97_04420 [Clostridiales bacterium]|nr:hypothetical protein [Clostridiales bacterium]